MGLGAARKDARGHHCEIVSKAKCEESHEHCCGCTDEYDGEPKRFGDSRIVAGEAPQRNTDFRKKIQQ